MYCMHTSLQETAGRTAAPRRAGTRGGAGFTLIELTMVLVILGLLMGLVLGLGRHGAETAMRAKARADLGELHHALARFHAEHEAYPPTPGGAVVAVDSIWLEPVPWAPEDEVQASDENRWTLRWFLPGAFEASDPWGQPYRYGHDAEAAPMLYELYAVGPNNPEDTDAEARIRFQP